MKMIIMAGGSGARLWPLSRTYYPKQFLKLPGMSSSIFQMTIKRCELMGSLEDLYVVTSGSYLGLITQQLDEIDAKLSDEQILLEPQAKNTLPAILYAVQAIREKGDDICAVFASDHVISQPRILADTILEAAKVASKGFVCFGITPTHPETGFGYIKPGKPICRGEQCSAVARDGFEVAEFKEKPDFETARAYVKSGYLWNSGMFMFESAMFYDAVERYNPEVFEAFRSATTSEKFSKTPSVSVDYGLIEKMEKVYCVPLNMEWKDIGNFAALSEKYNSEKDLNGNVCYNDEILIDSYGNFCLTHSEKAVALIGVNDLVVVEQEDALLICHRDQTQKIKDVVDELKKREDRRADYHLFQSE